MDRFRAIWHPTKCCQHFNSREAAIPNNTVHQGVPVLALASMSLVLAAIALTCTGSPDRGAIETSNRSPIPAPTSAAQPAPLVDGAGEWPMFRLDLEHTGTRGNTVP